MISVCSCTSSKWIICVFSFVGLGTQVVRKGKSHLGNTAICTFPSWPNINCGFSFPNIPVQESHIISKNHKRKVKKWYIIDKNSQID